MYYLVMSQDGEGCDYTIGCGTKIVPLKSSSIEGARAELPSILKYHDVGHPEKLLKACYIVKFAEAYDYNAWLKTQEKAD